MAGMGHLLEAQGLRPQTETPIIRASVTCLKNRQRFPSSEGLVSDGFVAQVPHMGYAHIAQC